MNVIVKQSNKNKIVISEVHLSTDVLLDTIKWFLEQRYGGEIATDDIELTFVYELTSLFKNEGETIAGFKIKGGDSN